MLHVLPSHEKAFLRHHALGIFGVTVLLVLFWQYPNLDFWVTDLFFDTLTGTFPEKQSWFWSTVMHDGVSKVSKIAQLIALVTFIGSFFVKSLRPYRLPLAYFVVVSLGSATIVSLLKNSTGRACPDDLIRYGGVVEFTPMFSGIVEMAGNRCWPGGHLLHALALLPLPFALRLLGWQRASGNTMIAVVIFALLLNHTQLIRGQHFLSHHLWTLWICWSFTLVTYLGLALRGKVQHVVPSVSG